MFIDNEAYCYQTTNIQEDFQLPSLRIVEREYIHEIEEGIKAFENYLINEFGQEVQFNYVSSVVLSFLVGV